MTSHRVPAAPAQVFIPSLDGIRAISFLLVFMGHSGTDLVPAGFGVTVFFFLSGYLITTLLRVEYARTGRVDLKQFYLRRLLRIWPPFYIVLLLGILLTEVVHASATLDPWSVAAQALHISNYWIVSHGWGGVVPGSSVYWSLAVEEHFYLLFPALFALLQRFRATSRQQLCTFLLLSAAVLAWRCLLIFALGGTFDRTYIATDTRIDSILFGCCLAVYANPALDVLPTRTSPSGIERLALALATGTILGTFLYRDVQFRATIRYSIQGLALLPVFSSAVRFPTWGPFRFLNWRSLRFLGGLSYSLYLLHFIVISALEQEGVTAPLLLKPSAFAISFAIAWLLWRFVEQPCARLRHRLASRNAAVA